MKPSPIPLALALSLGACAAPAVLAGDAYFADHAACLEQAKREGRGEAWRRACRNAVRERWGQPLRDGGAR